MAINLKKSGKKNKVDLNIQIAIAVCNVNIVTSSFREETRKWKQLLIFLFSLSVYIKYLLTVYILSR